MDPTKLVLSAYNRGSYSPAGSPHWPGTASLGTSGTQNLDDAAPPGGGTAINGFVPARFSSVSSLELTASGLVSDYVGSTSSGWSYWGLVYIFVIPVNSGSYNTDVPFFSDNGASVTLSMSDSGLQISQYDDNTPSVPTFHQSGFASGLVINTYLLVQARGNFTTQKIECRVNRGAWASATGVPSFWSAALPNLMRCGVNFNQTIFGDYDLLDQGFAKFPFTDGQFDDIGIYAQERYALPLGFPYPIPTMQRGADRIDRRQVERLRPHSARAQFWAGKIDPPTVTGVALLQPNIPTRMERHDLHYATGRYRMHASRVPHFAANISPLPVVTTTFSQMRGRHPDTIVRPTFKSSMQQSQLTIHPLPERTTPVADVEWPDRILKPFFSSYMQLATTAVSPLPERVTQIADVEWPDRIPRPAMRVEQQAFTTQISPAPEQPKQMSDVEYPNKIYRPTFPTNQQVAVVTQISPVPEQSTQLSDVEYPNRIVRPFFASALQRFTTDVPPVPEETIQISSIITPDYLPRARGHAEILHREFWFYPLPLPNAVVVTPVALTSYPDVVVRPKYGVMNQAALARPEQPERAAPLASVISPETVRRPAFLIVHQQMTVYPSPAPEQTNAIADVSYPSRIIRSTYAVGQQLYTSGVPPYPEETSQIAVVIVPEMVRRPIFSPTQQVATTQVPSQPEQTAPLADTRYPEVVRRPVFASSQQAFTTQISPVPERTSIMVSVIYPDTIYRPLPHASRQPFTTDLSPAPEQRVASEWQSFVVDRPVRPVMAPAQQQAYAANLLPIPLPQFGGTEAVTYQDIVRRPSYLVSQQRYTTFDPFPLPTAALTALNTGWVIAPERVVRPVMLAVQQLPTTNLSPVPEIPLPPADVRWPDRIPRPIFQVHQQLPTTQVPSQPERTAPIAIVSAPERVVRPVMPVQQQPYFAASTIQPERSQVAFDAIYPSRILRPSYPATQQLPTTQISPAPEQTNPLDWCAISPERIRRPFMPVSVQQVFATSMAPEQTALLEWSAYFQETVRRPTFKPEQQQATAAGQIAAIAPTLAVVFAPERIIRPTFPSHNQQAVATGFRPELPVASDWQPSFQSRVERPLFKVAHQQPVAAPLVTTIPIEPFGYAPSRITRPFLLQGLQRTHAFVFYLPVTFILDGVATTEIIQLHASLDFIDGSAETLLTQSHATTDIDFDNVDATTEIVKDRSNG